MIPLLIIAWAMLVFRSSGAGLGTAFGTGRVIGNTARGELFGISSRILFPVVVAGWFLIALVVGGLASERTPVLGWIAGLALLVVPTLLVYRSMHPEIASVPFDEWLGGLRPGVFGVTLLTWIACPLFIWSVAVWTQFVGSGWTTACVVAAIVSVFVAPFVALALARRWSRRLLQFVLIATILGTVTVLARASGITPDNPLL
jgi:hypothetical protein